MADEMHDPEMCYRRGYQQGAQQVLDAIKHLLPVGQSLIVHAWITEDVCKWRVAGLKGETTRPSRAPPTAPSGPSFSTGGTVSEPRMRGRGVTSSSWRSSAPVAASALPSRSRCPASRR